MFRLGKTYILKGVCLTLCQKPPMGKINGIFVLTRILKHLFAKCYSRHDRKHHPQDPPNSMLRALRNRPIYFSQFTHPHILKRTAPALNWGCGGRGSVGISSHAHESFTSTHKCSVPLIFPIDGLLFCILRFASRTEHCVGPCLQTSGGFSSDVRGLPGHDPASAGELHILRPCSHRPF